MLVISLPFENLPQIKLSDKAFYALELMYQYQVKELAVVDNSDFVGIIKEDVLLSADEEVLIKDLQYSLIRVFVNANDHLLKAVSVAVASHLTILPVTDSEQKLTGIVETGRLLESVADFLQVNEPGAIIVLEVDPFQYSFSEICRLVESNDAQITQLNTSKAGSDSDRLQITMKLNKLEVSDIVATFQRYEYQVKYYFGEELYENELKTNYENLMSYLNV